MTHRLLLIFAHPDDESFFAAGLCRRAADAGAEIALVTATLGQAGPLGDPPVCTREALPAVRRAELLEAAHLLGIAQVETLGWQDGALAEAPDDAIRRELVAAIRRHRPQVAVTFAPDGGNRHPDHIAISRFASDALAAAADPRWYPELGAAHGVTRLLWTPPLPPWTAVGRDLAREPGVDLVVELGADAAVKEAALRAHRSQQEPIDRVFLRTPDPRRTLAREAFRVAWGPPLPAGAAGDTFAH